MRFGMYQTFVRCERNFPFFFSCYNTANFAKVSRKFLSVQHTNTLTHPRDFPSHRVRRARTSCVHTGPEATIVKVSISISIMLTAMMGKPEPHRKQ